MIRSGIGYDSHRFSPDRPLILGGQRIPHGLGLLGHSDADVVTHAVIDAILGAAAAGDIGALFPDTDPAWKGADSLNLLHRACLHVQSLGFTPMQADVTIITEMPKLGPYLDAMAAALAREMGLTPKRVSVKAKTNEGMGFVGRGEGMVALAVATVEEHR